METIQIKVGRAEVYEEVAKATEYTGAKITGDDSALDRILASDADLATLGRMWEESEMACNEHFKEMLITGRTNGSSYEAELEVSKSFDKSLRESVESLIRSYFIASIIGQWFKYANKGESGEYFAQAGEFLGGAERLLYSRRRPRRPV